MTYITGDTHGRFGRIKEFCNEQKTTKEDIMIILGDVGINYYLDKRDFHYDPVRLQAEKTASLQPVWRMQIVDLSSYCAFLLIKQNTFLRYLYYITNGF